MAGTPKKNKGLTPQDHIISIMPSVLTGIIVIVIITITTTALLPSSDTARRTNLILTGVTGVLYLSFYHQLFSNFNNRDIFAWINAVISSIGIAIFTLQIPAEIDSLLSILIFVSAIASSLMSGRAPSYFLVIAATTFFFLIRTNDHLPYYEWSIHGVFALVSVMIVESIQQLKKIAQKQINRLETVNELSKELVSTLDKQKIYPLVEKVISKSLEVDSFYIAIMENDEITLEVFYDDGQYFNGLKYKREGSLANWVITNQQELFLPDLRKPIPLEGVKLSLIGKQKPTLSWMGVPIAGNHIKGALVISSYQPYALDRSDMEMLSTITQRVALALDNAHHHALVEEQARLDSLTRVYNHGYFIKTLREQGDICIEQKQTLGLIMLDIDHFKQYNDTFGHLIGDEILISLGDIICTHIKNTDSVGRWGGEEFAIALPNTNSEQALQIAQRIMDSMSNLKIKDENQLTIPVPTVSQGIAIFPTETDNITKLIDLADKRLYTAKKRGRNQIEPASTLP